MTDSGIGLSWLERPTASGRSRFRFPGRPYLSIACYRIWCLESDLISCLLFENLWGRTRNLFVSFCSSGTGGVGRTRVLVRLAQLARAKYGKIKVPGSIPGSATF